MVLIHKRYLELDIWPETLEQDKLIENIIRLIWGKEAYWQFKASGTKNYWLSLFGKEARFVGPLYCYNHLIANWNIDFGFYHGS